MGERADELSRRGRATGEDADRLVVRETEVRLAPGGSDAEDADTGTADTEEIRTEIEQTRAEMSQTIDAIQERLKPERLVDQAKDQVQEQVQQAKGAVRDATVGRAEDMVRNVGETASEARYTIVETIRENPIPAALAAIGLGWLVMNRRSAPARRGRDAEQGRGSRVVYRGRGDYVGGQSPTGRYSSADVSGGYGGYGGRQEQGGVGETLSQARDAVGSTASQAQERVGDLAGQAQDRVGDLAGQAQEQAGDLAGQAQQTAGQLANQAGDQARQASDWFQDTLRESPLAVGGVAFALGAVVGLAVPETEQEHQWMGEARDRLLGRATETAQETMEKVQGVVEQATDAASQAAQDQGLTTAGSGQGQGQGQTQM